MRRRKFVDHMVAFAPIFALGLNNSTLSLQKNQYEALKAKELSVFRNQLLEAQLPNPNYRKAIKAFTTPKLTLIEKVTNNSFEWTFVNQLGDHISISRNLKNSDSTVKVTG